MLYTVSAGLTAHRTHTDTQGFHYVLTDSGAYLPVADGGIYIRKAGVSGNTASESLVGEITVGLMLLLSSTLLCSVAMVLVPVNGYVRQLKIYLYGVTLA